MQAFVGLGGNFVRAIPDTARVEGAWKRLRLTVQDWANFKWSHNPKFQREYARIAEGLREAGLPEE